MSFRRFILLLATALPQVVQSQLSAKEHPWADRRLDTLGLPPSTAPETVFLNQCNLMMQKNLERACFVTGPADCYTVNGDTVVCQVPGEEIGTTALSHRPTTMFGGPRQEQLDRVAVLRAAASLRELAVEKFFNSNPAA